MPITATMMVAASAGIGKKDNQPVGATRASSNRPAENTLASGVLAPAS